MPAIKVLRTVDDVKLPTQATESAQCIDFYASEDVEILPGETRLVDLGVKLVLPKGYGLEFRERSGLATKGIIIGAGIIDEDYHGPLKAVVRYLPSRGYVYDGQEQSFKVSAGDKIVQAELVKRIPIEIQEIEEAMFRLEALSSKRGEKGFGSSDNEEARLRDLEAWREKYQNEQKDSGS